MGLLSHYGSAVTLINRTIGAGEFEQNLNARYDGEDITLKPGENPGVPLVVVDFAKRQNVLKGSVHPLNPNKFICLIGVKEDPKDICTPIPEAVMRQAAAKYENLDRSGEFWDEPMAPVKLNRKKLTYSPEVARANVGGGFDAAPTSGVYDQLVTRHE